MWPRQIEFMLGCWLMLSPFIFRHPSDALWLWVTDLSCGAAVLFLSLLSYARGYRYVHLATIGICLWLVLFGYFHQAYPTSPALQNDMLLGLLLMMLAIIPNEATLPPPSWRNTPPPKVLLYPEPAALSEREAQVQQRIP